MSPDKPSSLRRAAPISRRLAALCVPALLAFPGAAGAQPFKDRAIAGAGAHASRVQGTTQRYPTADGLSIPVTLAASYSGDPAVAQSYATFVGTLPHGAELADLRLVIVPAAEIDSACGGEAGTGILACYGASDQTMIVPGDQPAHGSVPTNYVIAHEYGHHIAAHRSNAPLDALDFGPKRWASFELVCSRTLQGRLAPGDQGENYLYNPGEAWAETYAHLVFPGRAWRFTPLLKPTQGSLAAAAADVTQPWAVPTTTTSTGSTTRTFKLPLTLDGAFTLQLSAAAGTNYDLVVRSGGKVVQRTSRAGSRDRIHYRMACRDRRTETLSITVVRRSGSGPYTLKASYAG
jgi:hypothetical protein